MMRVRLVLVRPRRAICTISTAIQIRPEVTCRPCVPTSAKNADREAAAIRTHAVNNQVMEFVDFHPDKSGTKQPKVNASQGR